MENTITNRILFKIKIANIFEFLMNQIFEQRFWYHSYNLKNVKNTPGVLLLVKLQAVACNFTKSNTPPWVFFTFFKLCTWY